MGGAGFLGAAVTAMVGLRGYRAAERNRNAEVAAQLLKRWQSPELYASRCFINSFETRAQLADALAYKDRTDDFHTFELELAFFEELGVMWKLRGVKLVWVKASIGSIVRQRWHIWQPAIESARFLHKQPTAYEHFQKLAEELEKPD